MTGCITLGKKNMHFALQCLECALVARRLFLILRLYSLHLYSGRVIGELQLCDIGNGSRRIP